MVACGPKESYEYVANKATCPDGTNPFDGNTEKARQSRKGSQGGQPNGHLIDVYELPCAGEARAVYVDMYGCPEYENELSKLQRESPQLKALSNDYDAGAFQKVLDRCQGGADLAVDEQAFCLWFVPAAQEALGRSEAALLSAQETCGAMPGSSPKSDARAQYLTMLLVTLSESATNGKYQASAEHRKTMLESFEARCGVSHADIARVMSRFGAK